MARYGGDGMGEVGDEYGMRGDGGDGLYASYTHQSQRASSSRMGHDNSWLKKNVLGQQELGALLIILSLPYHHRHQ
ncbi:hypothetical protein Tco_0662565 [Tanacetum coccineum]